MPNDADCSAKLYCNFDAKNIYFAVHARDDCLIGAMTGNYAWQNDGVELWFDFRLDSDTTSMFDDDDDYQLCLSYTHDNKNPAEPHLQIVRTYDPAYIRAAHKLASKPTRHGYILEFSVPIEALTGLKGKPGDAIGFDVTVCDTDKEGLNRLLWAAPAEALPQHFGIMTFGKVSDAKLAEIWKKAKVARKSKPLAVKKNATKKPKKKDGKHQGPPVINSVEANNAQIGKYEKYELTVDLDAEYTNPFDFDDINITATITSPSGKIRTIDGFLYQHYRLSLGYKRGDGQGAIGTPVWKLRYTPTELGKYTCLVKVRDAKKRTAQASVVSFTCVKSNSKGFLRASKHDPLYLAFDNGDSFYGIGYGAHLWAPTKYDILRYKHALSQLAAFGGNYTSVNLNGIMGPLNVEEPKIGQYSLVNGFKMDYVLEAARKRGIYIIPNLHQTAMAKASHWKYSRFNKKTRRGPCETAAEYFTHPLAIKYQKAMKRHIVARWGYSPNILGWELFNEVNYTDGFQRDLPSVRKWHKEMAAYLHKIDPNDHMVSTCFGSGDGCEDPEIWKLPEINFTITHEYTNDASMVRHRQRGKNKYNKPNFGGEYGMSFSGANKAQEIDRDGVFMHNAMWTCGMARSAGNILLWWQHRYHDSLDLYEHMRAFSNFARGIKWDRQNFKNVELTAMVANKDAKPLDVVLKGKLYWGGGGRFMIDKGLIWKITHDIDQKSNNPREVEADNKHLAKTMGSLLFGTDQKKPGKVHLSVNMPIDSTIDIPLKAVQLESTTLEIEHNGKVTKLTLADIDGKSNPKADEFKRTISLPAPAGMNVVKIRNTGRGWLVLGDITFRKASRATHVENAVIFGLQGKNLSILWFHNAKNTWYLRWKEPDALKLIEGISVTLDDAKPGRYDIEWWDTYKGKPVNTESVTVGSDGKLTITPPAFLKDVACKIFRK